MVLSAGRSRRQHVIIYGRCELPTFDQPIPSDFNHLHFGAGRRSQDYAADGQAYVSCCWPTKNMFHTIADFFEQIS